MRWVWNFISLIHWNSVSKKSLRSSHPNPTQKGRLLFNSSQQVLSAVKIPREIPRSTRHGPCPPRGCQGRGLETQDPLHIYERSPTSSVSAFPSTSTARASTDAVACLGSSTTKEKAKTSLVHGPFRILIGFIILFSRIAEGQVRPPLQLKGVTVGKFYPLEVKIPSPSHCTMMTTFPPDLYPSP